MMMILVTMSEKWKLKKLTNRDEKKTKRDKRNRVNKISRVNQNLVQFIQTKVN